MPRRRATSSEHDVQLTALCRAKLDASGITEQTADVLGLVGYTAERTAALHPSFRALRSLYIPYRDPLGNPLSDWPAGEQFFRIRYLEGPNDASQLTTGKSHPRYTQRPNTAPVAYYPSNVEWSAYCDDVDQPIILTEGELKAAKACQEGFPTIGLGGVYNWRSRKIGVEWINSLSYVTWLRRHVYICYDSDLRTNANVQRACWEFSEALADRGAFVSIVTLPELALDGETMKKTGLDDFLTLGGPSANEQFRSLLADAEPLGLSRVLFTFNTKYVFIRHPGLIIDIPVDAKIAPRPFKDHLESTRQYQERKIKQDGTISYQATSAAAAWLNWPLRHECDRLTYQPGMEREFHDDRERRIYNIWPGWGVTPKAGDISLFMTLLKHLFTDAEPEALQWFLQWCAYPLQYPGVKLFSSVAIHGRRHGTGKSLIGYTLGRIYGQNFVEITQTDLHSNFNEWAEGKQFVLGDDVTGPNKRQESDVLKKLITQRELRVNSKYIPSYVVPDCINYYFTSNHPDAFFLEDDDRRFFIHEVTTDPLPESFYAEYDLWIDSGGSAAVFAYLLALDIGSFNPAGPAFRTVAKERMIADGQSDLGTWVRALAHDPDHVLRVGEIPLRKDCYTSKELLNLYDPSGRTGTTANGLARELRRAGIAQAYNGRLLRGADGSQGRYYIVRNVAQWQRAAPSVITKHLCEMSTAIPPKY